jgi:hypothetical protein
MMAEDPTQMGEQVGQGIPGVGILMMLRKLGEQVPGYAQQAMQYLGLGQPPTGAAGAGPQRRLSVDEALRRQAIEEQQRMLQQQQQPPLY